MVALEKPTVYEQGQWYFQRYIDHLPTRGEMAFFDRSWYNRAGVERVMGFCKDDDYDEFLRHVPLVEKLVVETGITFFKYWFSVSRVEQARRFYARESNPLKQWKLSPIDRASLNKWDAYTDAKEAMFQNTDTTHAPWTIIKSDDKKGHVSIAYVTTFTHWIIQARTGALLKSRIRRSYSPPLNITIKSNR